ncbi:ECF-type sigma factor [Methyloprofundus sp.]|uniref:ECF-type sigma factor n=1 Tax=Methyloprofundus sp. TaxID=2020875 RepID=UPI003D0EAD9A
MTSDSPITQLLLDWRKGDQQALDQLTPIIYQSLRRLSIRHLSGENCPTIQPTELLHEAYMELVDVDIDWQDRAHFFAVASRMMRRMLINRAKHRQRLKRGGDQQRIEVDLDQLAPIETEVQILELNDALLRLAKIDQRKSDVLEFHFFGGLNYHEIATALSISEATVDRDLRFAKAWVHSEMRPAA